MTWILSYWGLAALTLLISAVATVIAYGVGDFLVKRGWFISLEVDFGALSNVGAVFAVALGLMTVGVWSGYSHCKESLPVVVDSLSEVYRTVDVLPASSRDAVRVELIRYLKESAPADKEDLIAHRQPSRGWTYLLKARRIGLAAAHTSLSDAWQVEVEQKFNALFTARRDWLNSFGYSLHGIVWFTLIAIAQLLLIGTALYPNWEPKQRITGLLIFALPVVLVFLCMFVLCHPLRGVCQIDHSYMGEAAVNLETYYGRVLPE